MNGLEIIEAPRENLEMPGNQEQPDVPARCHEEAFLEFMRCFIGRISIMEYMNMRLVSRQSRKVAEGCIRRIAKKIKIAKGPDSVHQDVHIHAKDDHEVLKSQMSDANLTIALRAFKKIEIRPIFLDLTQFDHSQSFSVVEALWGFDSWKHISLYENCSCYEDCQKISRFNMMTDIFSISPAAFMENKHGVNSLTIDAELPMKCADILKERSCYNIGVREVFDVFCSSIHFFARVLFIKGCNKTRMEKRYFEALMKHLRVEELIMYPESDEQSYLPIPGIPFSSPYSDMKFAELHDNIPVEYWGDSEEKIKLKVVSYTAVDRIPCTAVVERVCSWFETSKEMLIIFPKPRTYKELEDDVGALCSYLKKFEYPLISIRFTVYRNAISFPNLQRLSHDIRKLLVNSGFLYSASDLSDHRFNVEVESNFCFKKLRVTEIDPPPPPPQPVLQVVRADEEDAVRLDLPPDFRRLGLDMHVHLAVPGGNGVFVRLRREMLGGPEGFP